MAVARAALKPISRGLVASKFNVAVPTSTPNLWLGGSVSGLDVLTALLDELAKLVSGSIDRKRRYVLRKAGEGQY